jgi:hypothetical protein
MVTGVFVAHFLIDVAMKASKQNKLAI